MPTLVHRLPLADDVPSLLDAPADKRAKGRRRKLLDVGAMRKAAASQIRKMADSAAKSISQCVQSVLMLASTLLLWQRPTVCLLACVHPPSSCTACSKRYLCLQDSTAAEGAHQQHRWHDAGLAAAATWRSTVERLHITARAQPDSQACGAHSLQNMLHSLAVWAAQQDIFSEAAINSRSAGLHTGHSRLVRTSCISCAGG